MNDTTTALAIAEKKPQRSGGCVGIFFQIFDWNRRLAKKKLFPRKLLPPARAKQASKKFKGDEKMPAAKLHLIADENTGGFPTMKKTGNRCSGSSEQMQEMRAPSLVARLMGLESMPAVHRDKSKKIAFSDTVNSKEENIACFVEIDRENLHIEKGSIRPQKMQKTGPLQGRAVTRLSAEAFPIKGVLSRSRKNHHPKLPSPLKNPRISSAQSASRTSRLIDAASRILEPGLQARRRPKTALTYSSSLQYPTTDVVLREGRGAALQDLLEKPGYAVHVSKPQGGQTACQNCGNLLGVGHLKHNAEELSSSSLSSASNFVSAFIDFERTDPRASVTPVLKQVRENDSRGSHDQPKPLSREECGTMNISSVPTQSTKSESQKNQAQDISATKKSQKDESATIVFKHKNEARKLLPSDGKTRTPTVNVSNLRSRRVSSAASAVNEAKDFVALNRKLSTQTKQRVSASVNNSMISMEKGSDNKRDDVLSSSRALVRKRTTRSVWEIESKTFASPSSGKQKDDKCGSVNKKEVHSLDCTCIKNRSFSQTEGSGACGNRDNNVASFTFISRLGHKRGVSAEVERRDQKGNICKSACEKRNLKMKENYGLPPDSLSPISGDALGALLEEKLKELNCQEADGLTSSSVPPKKTTAIILQELISALTASQPMFAGGHNFNAEKSFSEKSNTQQILVGASRDVDHFSPGSVLETSFSNESCFSSSIDDGSGLCSESMDGCYDQSQSLDYDADSFGSEILLDKERDGNREMSADIVSNIYAALGRISLSGIILAGGKLEHAKEVMLKAELFLRNIVKDHADGKETELLVPSLLDKLENLAKSTCGNYNGCMTWENQCRMFLLDSIMECLELKYVRCCHLGFKGWTILLPCVDADTLVREVDREIKRWMNLSGMSSADEKIQQEMSWSLEEWNKLDVEAFEAGADIEVAIIKGLLEEIALDLWECSLGHCHF